MELVEAWLTLTYFVDRTELANEISSSQFLNKAPSYFDKNIDYCHILHCSIVKAFNSMRIDITQQDV